MSMTPTSSKSRRLSHEQHAGLPETFSPIIVSPGRSPIKGQLTGLARKVKDTCADWHTAVLRWEALHTRGMNKITEIANLKLENIHSEDQSVKPSSFPDGLKKLCEELCESVEAMRKIVGRMKSLTGALQGVANLEWHQENQSFCEEPLFQTWTTDIFADTSTDLVSMYEKELAVREVIIQSMAHTSCHDTLMFYMAAWLHQPYIDNDASLLLESMLEETGLR